jgi:hypothetical protein
MKALVFAAGIVVSLSTIGCGAASTGVRVAKPVALEGERPLTVRTDAGNLWVGAHAWSETRRAWKNPAQGQIEELSIRAIKGGHEISFVQGGLQWRGEVDGDHVARGPLQIVPALDARSNRLTDGTPNHLADSGK